MNESVNAYLAIYSGLRPLFIGKSHTKECTILRPSKRCTDHETAETRRLELYNLTTYQSDKRSVWAGASGSRWNRVRLLITSPGVPTILPTHTAPSSGKVTWRSPYFGFSPLRAKSIPQSHHHLLRRLEAYLCKPRYCSRRPFSI